jgi:hypothetical protein
MKTIELVYNSDTFLPKELSDKFKETERKVIENRSEPDKINCHIMNLRGEVLKWLSSNGKIKQD